jgi:hypothetical protein
LGCRAPYGIPLRATHFAWGNQVKKRLPFLRHLYMETFILPRQARDKRRESTQKTGVFPQVKGADRLSSEQVLELGAISAEASFAVNGGERKKL